MKGSPEKIKQMVKPESLPEDFDEALYEYTSQGFWVIGLSYKVMGITIDVADEVDR